MIPSYITTSCFPSAPRSSLFHVDLTGGQCGEYRNPSYLSVSAFWWWFLLRHYLPSYYRAVVRGQQSHLVSTVEPRPVSYRIPGESGFWTSSTMQPYLHGEHWFWTIGTETISGNLIASSQVIYLVFNLYRTFQLFVVSSIWTSRTVIRVLNDLEFSLIWLD